MKEKKDGVNAEDDQLPAREIVLWDMIKFPKLFLAALVAYLGIALVALPFLNIDFSVVELLKRYGVSALGLCLVMIAFVWMQAEIKKRRKNSYERFVDVDADARKRYEETMSAWESQRSHNTPLQVRENEEIAGSDPADSRDRQLESAANQTFESYFDSIRRVLEQKAAVADEKASILLDKGMLYSKLGILFFVMSIAAWQWLASTNGFKAQHIYGIASCSLMFVFIEFLSAWFLKQYRHFVDTSTYLIKVKSIFDRYMLSYLAANHFDNFDADDLAKQHASYVLEMLSAEIKWPDSYLFKNADASFARDSVDAISELARALRKKKRKKADVS